MARNVNRLVWANSFTNDKRFTENREPYLKSCSKCHSRIWMNPKKLQWEQLNTDGTKHICPASKPNTKSRIKVKKTKTVEYERLCLYCDKNIVMRGSKGKFRPYDENQKPHRCSSKKLKLFKG